MTDNHENLAVFQAADAFAISVYEETAGFSVGEKFGLKAELRQGAVAIATQIIDAARTESVSDFSTRLKDALVPAFRVRYLLRLSKSLGHIGGSAYQILDARCVLLLQRIEGLLCSIEPKATAPASEAG